MILRDFKKEDRGKGYGKELLRLGIEYVKENLNATRIDLAYSRIMRAQGVVMKRQSLRSMPGENVRCQSASGIVQIWKYS